MALPGGDAIGSRGLDMHIRGLAGARAPSYASSTGRSSPRCPTACVGANLWLDFPSVGATENLRDGGRCWPQGTTVIDNVAREPEIIDLCQMLVAMGAQIDGRLHLDAGRSTGVDRLHAGRSTRTVTDRIVAGTWVFAGRDRRRRPAHRAAGWPHHLDIVLDKLRRAGAEIDADGRRLHACARSGG